MPGHLGDERHVEHAVVRRAVVAGDAGAVEAEHDRLLVEADVVHDLVDRAGEERGVERDDRAQAAHRHARRRGDGVLLGDADVDEAAGEALAEGEQAGGVGHGGGDGHQLGPGLGLLDHRLAERGGVAAGLEARPGVVEALHLVVLGGRVPATLLREDVHDDRAVVLGRVAERLLHALDVVAVERARVPHAEVLEERRRLEHLAHGGHEPVDALLELVADHRAPRGGRGRGATGCGGRWGSGGGGRGCRRASRRWARSCGRCR